MKIGDKVVRKKYNRDVVFEIVDLKQNIAYLRGLEIRLIADSFLDDLEEAIEPWKTYPIMIRYSAANHTSPQYVFSRSAYRGFAYYVMFVFTSGLVSNTSAWGSFVYAPLVVV